MTREIEFHFDFGSPNAYLAYKVLPAIAARTKARIKTVPVLLGGIFKATGNQPPMLTFGHIPAKMAYEQLEMRRFIARHALDAFRFNPHFPVNTLMIMRGAHAAASMNVLAHYLEVVFRAMWEDGLKMDDPAVATAVLSAAGLDGPAIIERSQTADIKKALMDATEAAVKRGVFGIPTFFVGDEMFFGKDRLDQVEAAAG